MSMMHYTLSLNKNLETDSKEEIVVVAAADPDRLLLVLQVGHACILYVYVDLKQEMKLLVIVVRKFLLVAVNVLRAFKYYYAYELNNELNNFGFNQAN
jgi:hypothetical protein